MRISYGRNVLTSPYSADGEIYSFAASVLVSLFLMTAQVNDHLTSTSSHLAIIHQFNVGMLSAVMASMLVVSVTRRVQYFERRKQKIKVNHVAGIVAVTLHLMFSGLCGLKWMKWV